jgi:hypothetical protein
VLAELRPGGWDLTEQVREGIAARAAEVVHGRIEVSDRPERPAAERAALLLDRLQQAGMQAQMLALPAPGSGGPAWLAYQYQPGGERQDAINRELYLLQNAPQTRVRERVGMLLGPASEWDSRRGEPGEAMLYVRASADRSAAERVAFATTQLQALGASVWRGPSGDEPDELTLRVRYHTAHPKQKQLSEKLDQYKHEVSGLRLQETAAAEVARGGREKPGPVWEITR